VASAKNRAHQAVRRAYRPDAQAQARALQLLLRKAGSQEKAADGDGGEDDEKETRNVPANPSIPDK
jgi:hypothetical protein